MGWRRSYGASTRGAVRICAGHTGSFATSTALDPQTHRGGGGAVQDGREQAASLLVSHRMASSKIN